MADDRGPSYWDCSEYVQDLEARSGKTVRVAVLPPRRVGTSGKWTSWGVYVEVRQADGPALEGPARVEYFGSGGAWKTLPAALHAALRALDARLEARESIAVQQHRF